MLNILDISLDSLAVGLCEVPKIFENVDKFLELHVMFEHNLNHFEVEIILDFFSGILKELVVVFVHIF